MAVIGNGVAHLIFGVGRRASEIIEITVGERWNFQENAQSIQRGNAIGTQRIVLTVY
ncbi:UNVERIFIED_CONTAM: hypothetical protein BJ099_110137 [Lysinibacillus xylanilyticus]|uniref:hypothetical protein n=1 Tax=Lysinibacillus xylanilyticus TaxID=582475 RepID=UPI000A70146F|nr:hypothetical protein [Lysinibacillus xylanilyticus]